jgi:N-methylhydantoinase A
MRSEGMSVTNLEIERSLDMRYAGQGYEINVPCPRHLTEEGRRHMSEAFHEAHERLYAYSLKDQPIELVTYRVSGTIPTMKPQLRRYEKRGENPEKALKDSRPMYFEKHKDFVKTDVYDSSQLQSGNKIRGPAVVEYRDSTLVVQPGYDCEMDELRNIVIRRS